MEAVKWRLEEMKDGTDPWVPPSARRYLSSHLPVACLEVRAEGVTALQFLQQQNDS